MDDFIFERYLLLIILIPFVIFLVLFMFTKNRNDKFSEFINNLWYQWFSEQSMAIISFIVILGIIFLIGLCFS